VTGKLALCALLISAAVHAQKQPITVETLRKIGHNAQPAPLWMPDGKSFLVRQGSSLTLYDPVKKSSRTLADLSAMDAAAVAPAFQTGATDWENRHTGRNEGMEISADGKNLLYTAGGDLFLIRLDTGKWVQLTATPAREMDATLSPDGRSVAFRRGWDLYTLDVAGRKETRLTSNGSETLRNGALDWVYPEELYLNAAFWWSPDSKSIAYLQFDTSQEPLYPHEDLLGTRALYEPERYPQAGENNATVRLGVVAAAGGATRWYDIGETRDNHLIARAGWMPDSHSLYVLRFNRVQNRAELVALGVDTGARSTVFEESDPYWINLDGDIRFLGDGRHFLWTSQRGDGGFRHIFLYSNDGRDVRQITKGAWEVRAIEAVDEDAHRIFYSSGEPSHLERHLYSIGFDGQNKRQLSREAGAHEISMGPGGRYYLDTWSSLTEPPRTILHAGDGAVLGTYREPDRAEGDAYEILPTQIVHFQTPDGLTLYGRLIKPAGFQASRKYPAIVTVYGGPGVDLPVRNSWPGITIEQALAHHGYVVWQAENRGGVGRGHAFETAIYHKLGAMELADQVAGVTYLISLGFADAARIGIRGWSYGGFMAANALLNAPDIFKAGFSGAPVTDWRNYDTIYTERYMGLPKDNAEGYRETALPLKAAGLQGKLMLVHNFEDDNVLFQNSLQLVDALERAGKQFEYMLYPQKTHSVTGEAARQMNQMMVDFFDRALK